MSLFAWNPAYSVGCAEIDEQHQQLFQMADDLHRAMLERRGKETIGGLLKRLVAYTVYHFSAEERQMKQSGFPNYIEHHAEHVKLTQRVVEYQEKVLKGETSVSIEVLQFLSDWLKHHIQGSDQKVGAHLKAMATRP
ncbi:MAG TPA: bacteriohemerythrin [Bryobacteraceae bacterium]|nr:bacteriohemerythrin [Bryobacteraceae bacterium]